MGYNLYIGEAEVDVIYEERRARIFVAGLELPESPLNSTDVHTNYCWPSYCGWSEFCERVGLTRVFYAGARGCDQLGNFWNDEDGNSYEGILCQHPGAVALTPAHLKAFQKARDSHFVYDATTEAIVYDNRRLEWLCWWTNWALKNCQYPTFYNS